MVLRFYVGMNRAWIDVCGKSNLEKDEIVDLNENGASLYLMCKYSFIILLISILTYSSFMEYSRYRNLIALGSVSVSRAVFLIMRLTYLI